MGQAKMASENWMMLTCIIYKTFETKLSQHYILNQYAEVITTNNSDCCIYLQTDVKGQ